MPSRHLDFPVFDADNHFYETTEALTKYLPEKHKNAIQYVEVTGRTKSAGRGGRRVLPPLAAAPARREGGCAGARGLLLIASLPIDPSAPGSRPRARAARARSAVMIATRCIESTRAASSRTKGSSRRAVAFTWPLMRSTRPARWGYQE